MIENDGQITPQKSLVLSIQLPNQSDQEHFESVTELKLLASTLGCDVVEEVTQGRQKIHPGTFIGKGKISEIKAILAEKNIEVVIVNENLSPKQAQRLEETLHCLVMDRTQLILNIFASHAKTREAKLQIDLAQMQYQLPRLVGLWEHLDRERGGIGASRGTGEKQIDNDRQMLRSRIAKLKDELLHIEAERKTQKKRRFDCLKVSLIGYTNAGKSTIMNALTHSNLLVEDKLFATLESTTRLMEENSRPKILLSDTVGFIRNLPHELVASFHSTLEVVRDADLLLHIVDVASNLEEHIATTNQVLEEIDAVCIHKLLVFNKIDQWDDQPLKLMILKKQYPDALFVSAARGQVLDLQDSIIQFFEQKMETIQLKIDYSRTGSLAQIYELSRVDCIEYQEDGIHVTLTSLPSNINRLRHRLN